MEDEGKTDRPLYGYTSSSSSIFVENVACFLRKLNYETAIFKRYIVVNHKCYPQRFLVKIEEPENCGQYRELRAMILTFLKFRELIPHLYLATKSGFLNTSQLKENVITSFGWHAKLDEETRHRALECASDFWGSSHIRKLLEWLRSTWPKNPRLSHYADVVKADYCWFERECCTYNYQRCRTWLMEKIRHELVAQGMTPEFQSFLRNVESGDRCFIVTS